MKIQRYNWETMLMDDVNVDDKPMTEFVNWILSTNVWLQDPELLFNRVVHLKRQIAEGDIVIKDPPQKPVRVSSK